MSGTESYAEFPTMMEVDHDLKVIAAQDLSITDDFKQ